MVAVGDRFSVYSTSHKSFVEGKVVNDVNANGFWGVVYDNGEYRMKALNDWDIIPPAESAKITEHETVKERSFVVIVNDNEETDFDNELEAHRFAIRALRLGDAAQIYERKLVESLRLIDTE